MEIKYQTKGIGLKLKIDALKLLMSYFMINWCQ